MNYRRQSNRMLKERVVALASVAACSMAVAHATVSYQVGNGGLGTFNGSIDGTETFNNALAGGIKITEQGTPVNGAPTSYVSVCTDIEGVLYLGQTYSYNTPTTFASAIPSTGMDPAWGAVNTPGYLNGNAIDAANAMQALQNAASIFYNYGTSGGTLTGNSGISGTVDQLEALQLAVWSALYNTTANGTISGNRFNFSGVDSTVSADVSAYLNGLTGTKGITGDLLQPNPGNQYGAVPQELLCDLGPTPNGGPVSVPEAPTVFAGAAMLIPLAAGTIRILRRKQTV
jgi:hypothetical protein